MATNKVRANSSYIFYANLLDFEHRALNGRFGTVVNVYGCPKANTMGHCYFEVSSDRYPSGIERFLVSTNSLYKFSERQLVIDALAADAAKAVR